MNAAIAADTGKESEVKQLKIDVKNLAHDIEILRRDEVNYKIEKSLLKDAYSSNLETINVIITIVLGVLGVLGYLGIRTIKEIRADYTVELDSLKKLRTQLETEIDSLRTKQKEFESQFVVLEKTNEEQDRRLKVMELIEKISGLIRSRQWIWAQKYIAIGISLDPKNTLLLGQKSLCHANLGEMTAAISAAQELLEIEPENNDAALNLLEFLALTNQIGQFNTYYENYKLHVDTACNGALIVYLRSILNLVNGDLDKAKKELFTFISNQTDETKDYLENWSVEESKTVFEKMPISEQRNLLEKVGAFFKGKITKSEFGPMLT